MPKKTTKRRPKPEPAVGLIMGSQSDWATMRHAAATLEALGVPFEARIVSAHRTPKRMMSYASAARGRGLKVIIAGAGGAAHLPGMTAAFTPLPVLGVPVESAALKGQDSLLSIVQMPAGIPVGTLAIGRAGAVNAALLAASIVGLGNARVMTAVERWRSRQTDAVAHAPKDEPVR
jgi:5-(carboxyamino)imidazole ribonucleotide mutase